VGRPRDGLAARGLIFSPVLADFDQYPTNLSQQTRTTMRGKTAVITGGTSGIGEVAAVALAKMGARIILVARDKLRGEATLGRLRDSAPGIAHSVYFADLLHLDEMKRVAAQIAAHEPRIDVLINNAGALFASRRLTEDGFERTFALNHMAYFVMTAGRFGNQSGGLISPLVRLAKFFAISPAEGAETIVYLASSPDVAEMTGQYFYKFIPTAPSAAALDDRSALLLWQRSTALAGIKE
jgi:short chain dehydrogenase